jgi:cysteinyl-tRNA synthetase
MEGAKISKSAGKFPVLDDLIEAEIDPLAFRLFCFGAKYRSELAFSRDAVRAAESNLNYLYEFARNVPERALKGNECGWAVTYRERFHEALNNDLNTPQALAVVLEMIAEAYRRHELEIWNTLLEFDSVLGLDLKGMLNQARGVFPTEVIQLHKEREAARLARDFERADELRRELGARGYEIKDSKAGSSMLVPKRRAP